jgi:hypothetical protein
VQQKQNCKNEDALVSRTLEKVLVNSGFSENMAKKILKLYNPPELNESKSKKQ